MGNTYKYISPFWVTHIHSITIMSLVLNILPWFNLSTSVLLDNSYVPATQYGSLPDQYPLSRQYRWFSPTITKSSLQLYLATNRKIIELKSVVTDPKFGSSSGGHDAVIINGVIFAPTYVKEVEYMMNSLNN